MIFRRVSSSLAIVALCWSASASGQSAWMKAIGTKSEDRVHAVAAVRTHLYFAGSRDRDPGCWENLYRGRSITCRGTSRPEVHRWAH